jgi:hypothetical protein
MQYKIRLRPENSGSPASAERACAHVACAVRLFDPVVEEVIALCPTERTVGKDPARGWSKHRSGARQVAGCGVAEIISLRPLAGAQSQERVTAVRCPSREDGSGGV